MAGNIATAVKTCRILYYGAQDVGKRENLRLVHSSVPPENRLALASGDPERQIAFGFHNPEQGDWQVLVQCVDVGRERYRSAGMNPEPPFDGIVFVLSSRAGLLDQGMAAMESLKTFLDTWGLDLMGIPLVIQYNEREQADILPVDRLENLLNPWGMLAFPASTVKREGVRETLKAILGLTINHLKAQPARNSQEHPVMNLATEDQQTTTRSTPSSGLGLEYGPPVPGQEVEIQTVQRGEAIFDELNPPIVIPVKIPRRLLGHGGPVKLLLEVEVTDEDGY